MTSDETLKKVRKGGFSYFLVSLLFLALLLFVALAIVQAPSINRTSGGCAEGKPKTANKPTFTKVTLGPSSSDSETSQLKKTSRSSNITSICKKFAGGAIAAFGIGALYKFGAGDSDQTQPNITKEIDAVEGAGPLHPVPSSPVVTGLVGGAAAVCVGCLGGASAPRTNSGIFFSIQVVQSREIV